MKRLATLTLAALLLGISPALADNGHYDRHGNHQGSHDNRGRHDRDWNRHDNRNSWTQHHWNYGPPRHVVVRPAPRYYYQPVRYVYYPQPRPVYYYEQPRSGFTLWNIFGR